LGFVLAGVAAAAEPARIDAFHRWLENGYAGQMHYLEKRAEAYRHPNQVLAGCRTLLMLALPYRAAEPQASPDDRARVARYAVGEADYHDVIHQRLKQLKAWLEQASPGALVRGVVDTAPLLEREFAEAAGLGWVGKNTLLLNRVWGSYFFLAALLTDLPLVVDPPQDKGYCGSCTACLDACPTDAFVQPYVLDATRCLSYLTIEHRGPVAAELAQHFDAWVFGCDICQEVCPWNRKAAFSEEADFQPRADLAELSIEEILQLDEAGFRQRFRHTPLWRSKRRGILRNAILLSGGKRMVGLRPHLRALLDDEEPLVREAATWALHRLDERGLA
jgi:epoxyqueuosine reductase